MSTDESNGVQMVDEPTDEAREPISTQPRSQPSLAPAPPEPAAVSKGKQYGATRAAVEQSLPLVARQATEGDSTIDDPQYNVAQGNSEEEEEEMNDEEEEEDEEDNEEMEEDDEEEDNEEMEVDKDKEKEKDKDKDKEKEKEKEQEQEQEHEDGMFRVSKSQSHCCALPPLIDLPIS